MALAHVSPTPSTGNIAQQTNAFDVASRSHSVVDNKLFNRHHRLISPHFSVKYSRNSIRKETQTASPRSCQDVHLQTQGSGVLKRIHGSMRAPGRQSNVRCLTRCYCTRSKPAQFQRLAIRAPLGYSKADQLGRLGSKPSTHCRLGGSDVHLLLQGPHPHCHARLFRGGL